METRFLFSLLRTVRTTLPAMLAACVLAACGGGGGTGGTGTTTPPPGGGPTVSSGVMTKGSTIVNGVRFEDTTANISIDDTPKTSLALDNGMVVKVVGTVNDDGINGTAQRVKALVEARGMPTTVSAGANPQSLVLHGQTVLVDDQTVYSNLTNFNAIAPGTSGTLIEVHGLRDTAGQIRATRIEANPAQMGDSSLDELRGVVSGGTGTHPLTFILGTAPNVQTVDASAAAIVPAGASWPNGTVVEVYCTRNCVSGGVFHATRLKVEDDSPFQPSSGEKMEAEGLISGFTVGAQNFSVGSTPVTITGSTRFEGGIATDLANNVKVEAEGSWNGTRLAASKIEFKRSVIRLQGNVTAGGAQFTMDIAGNSVTVKTDSLTTGSLPAVFPACVQVRGQRSGSTTPPVVLAGEIITSCSSNSGRPFMQAPVEAEASSTLTLLGYPINVGTASQFRDINGLSITLQAFLNAVTPQGNNVAGTVPGTLVKAVFDSGTNAVREAELED